MLLYVLDLPGTEDRHPLHDYQSLHRELGLYSQSLLQLPAVVFANKVDKKPKLCKQHLEMLRDHIGLPIIAGSALCNVNLKEVVHVLKALVDQEN